MSVLPLEGIKVLDLTRLLPGPLCTLMLADLGAEILKVEPPGGGDYTRWFPPVRSEMSSAFAALNRNKRSLAIDLKNPHGVEAIKRIIPKVDVLLEGFRPGVMARFGLDYESVKAMNPGIVYASISGYGQTGPLAQRAGHDINYLARTGVLSVMAADKQAPIVPGIQIADVTGGSWMGVSHVLAGLFRKERTGEGCFCDIAMTEGLLPYLVMEMGNISGGAPQPEAGRTMLGGGAPCYNVYRCKGDGFLAVGSLEPKFWMGVLQALDCLDLMDDGLSLNEEGAATKEALQTLLLTKTREEWADFFAKLDVCVEPVMSIPEVQEDEHAKARGYFQSYEHPTEGPMTTPRSPFFLVGVEPPEPVGAPGLGENSKDILLEFDFSDEEIQALVKQGAVHQS